MTNQFDASLLHKISEFYKKIYLVSLQIPKKDRYGIYLKIENLITEVTTLSISACFEIKETKMTLLKSSRIKIEVLKRLIRITRELNIITEKKYLELELNLQEISKMTNGWIKYLKENPPERNFS